MKRILLAVVLTLFYAQAFCANDYFEADTNKIENGQIFTEDKLNNVLDQLETSFDDVETDIDDLDTTKADLDSPNLTGVPETPDAISSSGNQIANLDFVNSVAFSSNTALPGQSGNAGKVLKTDGTNASWQPAGAGINLLINSNFNINQEEYSSGVITTGEYGHDMWKSISSASYTVSSGALTIVSGTLGQRNDDLIAMSGETVTVSVVSGSIGIGATAGASATTINASTPYTFTLDMSGSAFVTLNAATSAYGLKIEYGSIATPYVVPEPKNEELRCYYYFQKLNNRQGPTIALNGGAYIEVYLP